MAEIFKTQQKVVYRDVTIANGQTTSDALYIGGSTLVGIKFPAAMTGTAVTFKSGNSNSSLFAVKDASNNAIAVTLTVSTIHNIPHTSTDCIGPYVQVVSGSNEGAARIITLILKNME